MPWIDHEHRLHVCQQPQWQEGEEVRASYSRWGCDICGRVYSLLVGRVKFSNTGWQPSYAWSLIDGYIYAGGK